MDYDLDVPMPKRAVDEFSMASAPIGASKFFPGEPGRIRPGVMNSARIGGYRVVTRTVTEGGQKGLRVWRDE